MYRLSRLNEAFCTFRVEFPWHSQYSSLIPFFFLLFPFPSEAKMRRLRVVIWFALAVLIGLALLMVFPRSRFTLLAVVRNQDFQNDRPEGYWAHQLKDEDAERRLEAVRTLNSMGERAKVSVPELAAALRDSDDTVRLLAALALSKMGPQAVGAVDALAKAL